MDKNEFSILSAGELSELNPKLVFEEDTPVHFVLFAMRLMKVGAAGIINQKKSCIGFLTERDVLDHIDLEGIDVNTTYAGDIMRPPNMAVYKDDCVDYASIIMDSYRLDWLPVIDAKTQEFCGLIGRENLTNKTSHIVAFSHMKSLKKYNPANAG